VEDMADLAQMVLSAAISERFELELQHVRPNFRTVSDPVGRDARNSAGLQSG
jgi:hypothetical protein